MPSNDSAVATGPRLIRLPGGRLGAETLGEAGRLAAGGVWFLGPAAAHICRIGRRGDRPALHHQERLWGARVSERLRIDWDIRGLDHVDTLRRTIVLPLHEGFADPLALLRMGLDLRFVARRELSGWPALGRYLRDSRQVIVDTERGSAAYRQLLAESQTPLDHGEALVVFPQGSILGIEVAFWGGAFHLAERLDAWVLPVVLTGSHRVWEYPYSARVRFGQPVSLRVLAAIPPHRAVEEAEAVEAELKQLALDGSQATPRRFRPEIDGYWDDYRYEIGPEFPELVAQVAAHRELIGR